MEIWCHKRIPVEGNFGQTYDSLNQSIHGLYGEFSANIDIKVGGRGVGEGEEQIGVGGEEGGHQGTRQGEGQVRGPGEGVRVRKRGREGQRGGVTPACGRHLSGMEEIGIKRCQLMWVRGSKTVTEAGEQLSWGIGAKQCVPERLQQAVHPFPSQEEKQAAVLGLSTPWEHVSVEVRDYVRQQEAHLQWTVALLQALLSCTFLLVFHA